MSRICAGLHEHVERFRTRPLGHVEFTYVYLDATYVNVRDASLGQLGASRLASDVNPPVEMNSPTS